MYADTGLEQVLCWATQDGYGNDDASLQSRPGRFGVQVGRVDSVCVSKMYVGPSQVSKSTGLGHSICIPSVNCYGPRDPSAFVPRQYCHEGGVKVASAWAPEFHGYSDCCIGGSRRNINHLPGAFFFSLFSKSHSAIQFSSTIPHV